MVPTAGIELATYWLQVSCSTNWAKSAHENVCDKFYFKSKVILAPNYKR